MNENTQNTERKASFCVRSSIDIPPFADYNKEKTKTGESLWELSDTALRRWRAFVRMHL